MRTLHTAGSQFWQHQTPNPPEHLKQTLAVCILHLLKCKMGLIPCFSSAGFSLRQHFKTNRLSVGTMWKWFRWGFLQPSSHHGVESIRVPSASEVFAGGVGGLDRRRGSHLRWLGFQEVPHHLLCFATAHCASRNQVQHQSHQLSPLPFQWSPERAATETTESAVPKTDRAYSVTCGNKKKKNFFKSPSPLTTMHPPQEKLPPNMTTIGSHSVHLLQCTGHLYLEENKEQMLGDWKTRAFHCFIDLSPQRNLL